LKKISLYIPIELKARELAPKVFLSLIAAKKNLRVYLGTQETISRIINTKKKAGGVYFFKGGLNLDLIKSIKKKCSKFIILDEEAGPGDENPKFTMRERIYKNIEQEIDRYYILGKKNFDIAQKIFKNFRQSLVLSGWPRIDFFKLSAKQKKNNTNVRDIINKFGEYILFVSDFGQNSKKMISYTKSSNKKIFKNNKKKQNKLHKTNLDIFTEFNEMTDLLMKLDKDNSIPMIIIRPHPSEDHEPWDRISKKLKKFKVISEGDISPWIYGSRAILHRGCSTSIQAYLGNIPQGYIVINKKKIRKALPYTISKKLFSFEDIKNFCQNVTNEKNKKKEDFLLKKKFNEIIHVEKKFASELIIEDIIKMNVLKENLYKPDIITISKNWVRNFIHKYNVAIFILKNFFLNYTNNVYERQISRIVSQHQKIPFGIKLKDIKNELSYHNFKDKIMVKQLFTNAFVIEKKN
jgi:surface carbohydrate biosynthesis protein